MKVKVKVVANEKNFHCFLRSYLLWSANLDPEEKQ